MQLLILLILFSQTFDSLTIESIRKALSYSLMELKDLDFEKRWSTPDSFRLKRINRFLKRPMELPFFLDSSEKFILENYENPSKILSFEAGALFPEIEIKPKTRKPALDSWQEVALFSKELLEHVGNLIYKAFSNLQEAQRETLLYEVYDLWSDEEDSTDDTLKGQFLRFLGIQVDTSWEIKNRSILRIAKKIDYSVLFQASFEFVYGLYKIRKSVESLNDTSFSFDTPYGKVVVAPKTNDIHKGKGVALLIDLGGNDKYLGSASAGVYKAKGFFAPISAVLDMGGDDVYKNPEGVAQGAGVLGIGILWDVEGNDIYISGPVAQGAGLFGIGLLFDEKGKDFYNAGFFAQGAGCFGSGTLMDIEGDDTYRIVDYGQAFSSVWGYGLLFDKKGNDLYYAGGHYRHRPLLPDRYRSFAQGFSIGWRPEASGGISLLIDAEGNDFYNAEVYAQGVGYWYSLGMLDDLKGNDFYLAAEYAQGAGIHLALGMLVDRTGKDHYFSEFGPSQGEGHDYSVGVLVDEKGNDHYTVSGGIGIGLYNSVGIFVDKAGNDTYMITEKLGIGDANFARRKGGIGIFIDEGGKDVYPLKDFCNNCFWQQGTWGVGLDTEAK